MLDGQAVVGVRTPKGGHCVIAVQSCTKVELAFLSIASASGGGCTHP